LTLADEILVMQFIDIPVLFIGMMSPQTPAWVIETPCFVLFSDATGYCGQSPVPPQTLGFAFQTQN